MHRICLWHVACLPVVLSLLLVVAASESNWPRWRGPQQDGHTTDANLPVKWTDSNVVWKTQLPGIGQSSPIIWGERIFLTAALDQRRERVVFCVDRKTGKIEWQQTAWKGEPEKIHVMNSWASASCVTDGQIVVAFFGLGGLHAYTVDGKPLWSRDLGKFEGPWGTAACPILVDDLVVQNCDADTEACLIALRQANGQGSLADEAPRLSRLEHADRHSSWRAARAGAQRPRRGAGIRSGDGPRAVVLPEPRRPRRADDHARRRRLVRGKWPQGRRRVLVRPGGNGDVSSTHKSWSTPRKGARDTPSPIVVGDFILVSDMDGVATCYSVNDGHIYWRERLNGKFSGSPIAAGGLVYLLNEAGTMIVIKPGPQLEIVSENELTAGKDEIFRATPTPCDGQLFVPGAQHDDAVLHLASRSRN